MNWGQIQAGKGKGKINSSTGTIKLKRDTILSVSGGVRKLGKVEGGVDTKSNAIHNQRDRDPR